MLPIQMVGAEIGLMGPTNHGSADDISSTMEPQMIRGRTESEHGNPTRPLWLLKRNHRGSITIGIDSRTMVQPALRGTGKTLAALYAELIGQAPDWHFRFYYEPRPGQQFPWHICPANATFVPLVLRGHRWNLWEQVRLPWQAWRDRVNLLHCPAQTAPAWKPTPTVVTIHDLIPFRFDDGCSEHEATRLRRNIKRSLRQAAALLTISDYSHRDLLDLFPAARKQRIERLSWAPGASCRVLDDQGQVARICTLYRVRPKRFLLALGAESPRKNTYRLLEAFALACRDSRFQLDLLIGGLQATALVRFKRMVESLPDPVQARIHLCKYLPDEHMAGLYNGAVAFVFPSFYEGFGLPLLDAMACGCPVLASRRTSIPEVASDAALYFEPDRTEQMADAMTKIASDAILAEKLKQTGLARSAEFSWADAAARLHALFRDVLESSPGTRGMS